MTRARIGAVSLVGLLLGAGAAAAARPPEPVVVGVLENRQCEHSEDVVVRALFAKTDADWIALDARAPFERVISPEMSWTVAFDGKDIGSIRTVDPKQDIKDEWTFARDRLLELAPNQRPPRRVTPGGRFDGWCNPVARPLVVVTPANFTDPDAWKPFSPGLAIRETLLAAFRAAVGRVLVCPGDPENFQKAAPFRFTARDLKIVRAYRNGGGRTIVGIEFADMGPLCRDPTTDSYSTQWFLADREPRFLAAGLQLVDAGDYDADGKGELVFAYSGYNHDGYTLFANDFRKRVDVRWSYH